MNNTQTVMDANAVATSYSDSSGTAISSCSMERRRSSSFRRRRRFSIGSSEHGDDGPSILDPPSTETSESMHKVAAEIIFDLGDRRGRNSIVDVRQTTDIAKLLEDAPEKADERENQTVDADEETPLVTEGDLLPRVPKLEESAAGHVRKGVEQIPAVLLVCLLNLMISIPFGAAMFIPDGGANSSFPLPGKESLGIRVFLFTTVLGQIVYAFASKFTSAISLEMVENVPFWHALAYVVHAEQGYGVEALSTLFFLFGFSSVIVGLLFYLLGKLRLGRVVYYFPAHVLVGCIGGISIFITVTSFNVSTGSSFTFSKEGLENFVDHWKLFFIVVGMEATLRILTCLTRNPAGQPRFPLLAPLFFCCITPIFYLCLVVFGIDMTAAVSAGCFFPPSDGCDADDAPGDCGYSTLWDSIFNEHLLDMWRVFNFATVSWAAVFKALPTVVSLGAFSLIHVPINIPAFAISIDADTDMNAELIAHGYSNVMSGVFGGLQNYLCYSNSILYAKCGGEGKASSLAVAVISSAFFFIGPRIASYIPRCMAGTLLLHIGIDLMLEGLVDSLGKFDHLEYAGIWLITIVMTVWGMSAALIAGIISALSTYAVQSITHLNPIRSIITASTLRSSSWERTAEDLIILDDERMGRNKILAIQLQGHLFFGNVALMADEIKEALNDVKGTDQEPWIIILDFSLVVAMDSSAAHAIVKMRSILQKTMRIEVTVFVTGCPDGFPCEFNLSKELSSSSDVDAAGESFCEDSMRRTGRSLKNKVPTSRVCIDLDSALIFAEDILLARADANWQNRSIARENIISSEQASSGDEDVSLDDEMSLAVRFISNLYEGKHLQDVSVLVRLLKRKVYRKGDVIWKQGSESSSAMLLVRGSIVSHLEGTDTSSESIPVGNFLGEVGLVYGAKRLTTVQCASDNAVLYSLSKDAWDLLSERQPRVARIMDMVAIRYLTKRCQHPSNRIFETRCLPI